MSWPVPPHGFLGSQASTAASDNDTYQISKSLRFNSADSALLNRTFSTAGNRKTWTWSGWVKRSGFGVSLQYLFCSNVGAVNSTIGFYGHPYEAEVLALDVASGQSAVGIATTQSFRDPSAWYHIVASVDTTQIVQENRFKLFVNGSQITSLSRADYTSSYNTDYYVNSAGGHVIGCGPGNTNFFNGYMAEVNFIDGQALTPSSFGETDAITGRWKAKAFAGTYGTNGFYLPFSNTSTGSNSVLTSEDFSAAMYTKDAATVTTNTTTAPNGTTTADTLTENSATAAHRFFFNNLTLTNGVTFTSSIYVKANTRSAVALENWNGTAANYCYADLSTGTIISGSHASAAITSVGNGWYRISVSNVGTGAAFCGSSLYIKNNSSAGGLGYAGNGSGSLFIWGAQTEASSTVGPYLATTGTAIGSYMIVTDASVATGGYNNWFANNLSVTAGAGNDSLVDSPTNYGTDTGVGGEVRGNYATHNPIDNSGGATLSNGNLDVAISGLKSTRSTIAMRSGKWYCECLVNTVGNTMVGLLNSSASLSQHIGSNANSWGYYHNGQKYLNNSATNYGNTYTNADIIGIAYNADSGKLWFSKNGTWQASGDPVAGTNEAYSSISGDIYFGGSNAGSASSNSLSFNFGQRPFAYTAPTGFKALCTTNLTTPTIKKPSSYFDAVTYTGNSASSRSITGLGFSPDLVWLKSRSLPYTHGLHDTVRGASRFLATQVTSGDIVNDVDGSISAFNSDGFTISSGSTSNNTFNTNTATYVAWAWDEAPIAGMDIATYTGNGVSNSFSHNLGVSPSMVVIKSRSGARGWYVYHKSVGTSANDSEYYYLLLNGTNARTFNASNWIDIGSGGISVGLYTDVVASGENYIAYCFAEIEGFSKFGSYTGNGSADGPFVYCGFRPRWVMIKRTDDAFENWQIQDSVRSVLNPVQNNLFPDLSRTEQIGGADRNFDFVSNGFKLRGNNTGTNFSNGTYNGTYIFAAFAESPFKYARAR